MSELPILWIHGFPLSSAVFARQRAIGGARHIMPDLPGFGSTPPQALTIDGYAEWLRARIDEPAVVAGLSMGGYVAFALTRIAPELVRGLILIDTRDTADTDAQRKGRYESIARVERDGTRPVVEAMLPKMLTPSASPELVREVRGIMESASAEGVIHALRAMAERPAATPLLPSIAVRTLIVVGEDDAITPPADAERMANAIPRSALVRIANAAHLSNLEQADVFNAAVQGFIETIGSDRSPSS